MDLVDFGWQLTFSKEDFEMSCLIRSSRVIWTLQARTQTFDRQVMKLKVLSLSVKPRGFCERVQKNQQHQKRSWYNLCGSALLQWLPAYLLARSVDLQRICNQGLSDLLTWLPPPLLNADWQTTSPTLRCCKEYQRNGYICMVNNLNIIRHTLFCPQCWLTSNFTAFQTLQRRSNKKIFEHYVPPPVLSQLCCFSDVASSPLWAVFLREGW